MKVPVFTELQKLEFKEKPKPEIHEDEVLMKVEYCGICGSDVHGYLNGIMVPLGTVMGHECSGVVAEIGAKVKNFTPGDRVVAKPIPNAVSCYWCRKASSPCATKLLNGQSVSAPLTMVPMRNMSGSSIPIRCSSNCPRM